MQIRHSQQNLIHQAVIPFPTTHQSNNSLPISPHLQWHAEQQSVSGIPMYPVVQPEERFQSSQSKQDSLVPTVQTSCNNKRQYCSVETASRCIRRTVHSWNDHCWSQATQSSYSSQKSIPKTRGKNQLNLVDFPMQCPGTFFLDPACACSCRHSCMFAHT